MDAILIDDMAARAKRALSENMRHWQETLFALLAREFTEASDDEIDAAIARVL